MTLAEPGRIMYHSPNFSRPVELDLSLDTQIDTTQIVFFMIPLSWSPTPKSL